MEQSEVERKKELICQLACELGIRLQGIGKDQRGAVFSAQRFQALADTADKFSDALAGASQVEHAQAADDLVDYYVKHYTKRTGKSEAGGARNGYKHIVKCGRDARLIFESLQGRLSYWESVKGRASAISNPQQRTESLDEAERHLRTRHPDKHMGRPERNIEGVLILRSSGGTNRNSMASEVARLFLEHGKKILRSEVIDAILDNGGVKQNVSSPIVKGLVENCKKALAKPSVSQCERNVIEKALSLLQAI